MRLSFAAVVVVVVVASAIGAGVLDETPFIVKQLAPVLSLTWEQIDAASSPLGLNPIPSSFASLDADANGFQSSLLEEFRQYLAHRLRVRLEWSQPDFRQHVLVDVHHGRDTFTSSDPILIDLTDSTHGLNVGDVVLLWPNPSPPPLAQLRPSLELAVITERSSRDRSIVRAFVPRCLNPIRSQSTVSVHILGTALPTLNRLETLQLHHTQPLYAVKEIDADLGLNGPKSPLPTTMDVDQPSVNGFERNPSSAADTATSSEPMRVESTAVTDIPKSCLRRERGQGRDLRRVRLDHQPTTHWFEPDPVSPSSNGAPILVGYDSASESAVSFESVPVANQLLCVICYKSLNIGKTTDLPCSHKAHVRCQEGGIIPSCCPCGKAVPALAVLEPQSPASSSP